MSFKLRKFIFTFRASDFRHRYHYLIFLLLLSSYNQLLAQSSNFNFNTGDTQNWITRGPYNQEGTLLTSNFSSITWSDSTNYPNPIGSDTSDLNGSVSFSCENETGVVPVNQDPWWIMEIASPDLSTNLDWQVADGYSIKIIENMSTLRQSTIYVNLSVKVHDNDLGIDRFFYNDSAQAVITNSWNSYSFNWSTEPNFPTNYTLLEVFVNIWGTVSGFYSGGVFLDEVNIIDSIPGPPILLEPTNNATDISITPTLTWQSVEGASYYSLRVFDSDLLIFEDQNITGTSRQIGPLNYSTSYDWIVNARNGVGEGFSSEPFFFTTIPEPILIVDPPNQDVSYQTGDTTFSVTSNLTWSVSDNAAWLTVSPPGGTGNEVLIATYTENTTTSQRIGTITVTGGGITEQVTVTQAAGPAVLTVTPLNQSVTYASGDTTFAVTSNVTWTVSDNADWLTVSPPGGTGNGTLTATFTENTTTNERTGTITVTGGGITQQVMVIQAGIPTLYAVPNSLSFGDVIVGTNSASQSYNLTGSNLLSDVTITAPSGFTLSTSQQGIYTDTIVVPWDGEAINSTIWVRFSPKQVQQYIGNITNTATGVVVDIPIAGVGITYPSQIPVNVSYSFPYFSSNKNYQIIGLPGENDFSLKNIMPANPYDWRAFWDPGSGDYIEYDGTELFNFRSGRAFWIISRYQINVNDTFNTVSLALDNSYSISVHNEWNLISNPFDKNIFWQDVKNANPGLDEPIYYFHSGDYDSSEVFEMYKGYYFYNNPSLEMESLKIPYISYDNSIPKVNNQVNAQNELEILLSEKNIALSSLILGYSENANPGVDSFDKFSPPAGFSEINFAIYNKELETNYKYLRKDVRPAIGEGQEYDLVVKNTSDKNLVFTTLGLENFENYMVCILDKSTMKLCDLRKQNIFEVKKNASEKHFSLFIGTEEYINEKGKSLIPAEYTLFQNYPNPFNPNTTIMYALPNQSMVSLNVYNVLGELISVLINNELQEAGYHQVIFKGNSLSSGVYIYKLVAGDYTYSKKMLIIK